jgi:hypothetical protein
MGAKSQNGSKRKDNSVLYNIGEVAIKAISSTGEL